MTNIQSWFITSKKSRDTCKNCEKNQIYVSLLWCSPDLQWLQKDSLTRNGQTSAELMVSCPFKPWKQFLSIQPYFSEILNRVYYSGVSIYANWGRNRVIGLVSPARLTFFGNDLSSCLCSVSWVIVRLHTETPVSNFLLIKLNIFASNFPRSFDIYHAKFIFTYIINVDKFQAFTLAPPCFIDAGVLWVLSLIPWFPHCASPRRKNHVDFVLSV